MILIINEANLPKIFGFFLIIVGIIIAGFSGGLCGSMCSYCLSYELSPCYYLFIFVGIILIVNGASLIIIYSTNNKRGSFWLGS